MNRVVKANILIAGSNGIIGSELQSHLTKSNRVISIGNESCNQKDYIQLNLLNQEELSLFVKKIERPESLVFLVGLAHEKGKKADFNKFFEVNVKTLENIMAHLHKVEKTPNKIIFSSTISVYGERLQQISYSEDLTPIPETPYAKTKYMAEEYLRKHYADKSYILRFAPVYSERFQLNIDRRTKFMGHFFRVAGGRRRLSLLNTKNINKAISAILLDEIPPGTYNLTDNQSYSYNDLLIYKRAKHIIRVPVFIVKLLFLIGYYANSMFLKENSIKLVSDNIYDSGKISQFIELNNSLL
jgi:nucleoside-diphosphate-sugar epimerase